MFAISWRNPEQAQGHFDLDTYANAVAQARDAAASITEQATVHLAAACSGGIVTAGLLGQLAASGELDEMASLTLMACALDNDTEGTMSALASRDVAAAAVAESARKGYLDGQALQGVFTWLRPNDLGGDHRGRRPRPSDHRWVRRKINCERHARTRGLAKR